MNDPTPRCREAAADVIASLARRVDPDIVSTFIRYAMKWLSSSVEGTGSAGGNAQARALVRTGSQVAGLMVTTRPDLFKKLGFVMQAVASVRATLVTLLRVMEGSGEKRGSLEKRETSKHDEGQGDGGGAESWAVSYHLLVLIEKYVLPLLESRSMVLPLKHISSDAVTLLNTSLIPLYLSLSHTHSPIVS